MARQRYGRRRRGNPAPRGSGGRESPALLRAGVLVEELGDLLRVIADHDVGRHDRPGIAAVADREQRVVESNLALVEVRAVGPLTAGELALRLGAVGVRPLHRVTARAALVEEGRAFLELRLDIDLAATAARRDQRKGGRACGDQGFRGARAGHERPHSIRRPVWMRAKNKPALVGVLALALPDAGARKTRPRSRQPSAVPSRWSSTAASTCSIPTA